MGKFKIEKGYPLPKVDLDFKIFPFSEMIIGDSFLVHKDDLKHSSIIQTIGYMYHQIKQFRRFEDKDKVFSIQRNRKNQTIRVFRIY